MYLNTIKIKAVLKDPNAQALLRKCKSFTIHTTESTITFSTLVIQHLQF